MRYNCNNHKTIQDILKARVIHTIYQEDTIASHTKSSSQALHPIEAAYFHQSHLKRRQDYGNQVVSVMLSCNGIILNYAVILYVSFVTAGILLLKLWTVLSKKAFTPLGH